MAAAQSEDPAPPPPLPRPPTPPPEPMDHPPCPGLSPSPQPLHCPGQGVSSSQLCSALLPNSSRATLMQSGFNSSPKAPCHNHKPSILTLPAIQLFELYSILLQNPFNGKSEVQGQRCCQLCTIVKNTLYM